MDFKRARRPEQKDARILEITSAAKDLLTTKSFDAITLKEVANACSFSRINIYNYFKVKEEIYLTIYEQELMALSLDIKAVFDQYTILNPETFASLWVETIIKHQSVLHWYAVAPLMLHPQASEDFLQHFTLKMHSHFQSLKAVIHHAFPLFNDKQALDLLSFCLNFGSSLFTHYDLIHALQSTHDHILITPHFNRDYRDGIVRYAKGLSIQD